MANYSTQLSTWGSSGSAPPNGYSYVEGEQPVDDWDNFVTSNLIENTKHLISLTNSRVESDTGSSGNEPASPEASHMYHDTTNEALSFWDSSAGVWHRLLAADGDTLEGALNFDGKAAQNVGPLNMSADLDLDGNDLIDGPTLIWDSSEGHFATSALENDSVTITAGSGLTGGGTVALGDSISISTDADYDNFDHWVIEEGDGENQKISSTEKLIISGGNRLNTELGTSGGVPHIAVHHNNTSSQGDESGSGTFVLDSVSLDGAGHVTSMDTRDLSGTFLENSDYTPVSDIESASGLSLSAVLEVPALDCNGSITIGDNTNPVSLSHPASGGTVTRVNFDNSGEMRFDINNTDEMVISGGLVTVPNDFAVNGNKNFVIDHPSDPENKDLRHGSYEGPNAGGLIYRDTVTVENGTAEPDFPDYVLNGDFGKNWNQQATPRGHFGTAYVDTDQWVVHADQDGKYDVMITGERTDPGAQSGMGLVTEKYSDESWQEAVSRQA